MDTSNQNSSFSIRSDKYLSFRPTKILFNFNNETELRTDLTIINRTEKKRFYIVI